MLQWSSNAGHYDIYVRDKQGRAVAEAPDIVGGATNENYHEFYGLQPDKEYFFSIRARTEGGTQGCISKNASETVSARTDPADLNQSCSNYARTAMENVEEMRKKQCELPGSPYSGNWATSERTHFLFCLEQKRARLNGDANAQWLRNRDLWACEGHANKCLVYERDALAAERSNKILGCGYKGSLWSSDGHAHYSWCMRLSENSALARKKAKQRTQRLKICRLKKAQAAQASAGQTSAPQTSGGNGGDATCIGVPEDWAKMLAAHNEFRAQYCGAPLTWSCDLAKGAQAFADKCECGHSNTEGVGENLAAKSVVPDQFPATDDRTAFDETWSCEQKLYDFNNPVIVGGFKTNCLPPPAGTGVNGHFTQVVWKSTKELGCARARCPIKDKDCKVIEPATYETHWVCWYRGFDANGKSIGGNDSSKLAQNVQKAPACTQSFHSRTISCLRGMVPTDDGSCACPPGTQWDGRSCAAPPRPQSPARIPPIQPPAPPVCPAGTHFERTPTHPGGACLVDTGGGATTSKREDKQQSTPRPPAAPCPAGTHFERTLRHPRGACVVDTGGGATTSKGTDTQQSTPRPPAASCPAGTHFERTLKHPGGACVVDTGVGGPYTNKGNDTQPNTPRPPPCPAGTHFARTPAHPGGACVSDTGNGSTQGPTPKPATPTPNPAPAPAPSPKCTGGRIGTPPNCFCRAPSRFIGGRCRILSKPTPTPTGPTPHPTCPSGTKPPDCSPIVK